MKKKNLHLIVCVIVLIPIAFTYGLSPNLPDSILKNIFDFKIESTDLKNILRAIMGLYLAMATLWIAGIKKAKYWRTATISVVVFMGGLAAGRLISFVADGMPSLSFLVGTFGEIVLAFWGFQNLKKEAALKNGQVDS